MKLNFKFEDEDSYRGGKQPMKREKHRENDGQNFQKKIDKRKRREAFERKRGG